MGGTDNKDLNGKDAHMGINHVVYMLNIFFFNHNFLLALKKM